MGSSWSLNKVRVFVSYQRTRQDLRKTFVDAVFDHALRQVASVWTDDSLDPGAIWEKELRNVLENSDVILLLLTPEFLASEYCVEVEGAAALRLAANGSTKVFAVLLEECDYASQGLDAVPLLSDIGKPLRSSASERAALEAVRLEVKYAVYERYEARHDTIDELFGETGSLLSEHDTYGTPTTTRRGMFSWLVAGAVCGGAGGLAWESLFGVHQWWLALVMTVAVGAFLGASAMVTRLMEMAAERGSWPVSDPYLVFMWIPAGTIHGICFGIPLALLANSISVARAPAMVTICTFLGIMQFVALYKGTRTKHLAIYQDLVRARRSPPGGWRIDRLGAELEQREELSRETSTQQIVAKLKEDALNVAETKRKASERPASTVADDVDELKRPEMSATEWFRRVDEEMKLKRKRDREERRTRWRERPRNGTPLPLLAVFDAQDEPVWRALETTLREEGVDDLCELRLTRSGPDSNWVDLLDGVQLVMPLLSARFVASPEAGRLEEVLAHGPVDVYPVQIEKLAPAANGFKAWQFLPQSGPVDQWPLTEAAYQNVARLLIERLVHRHWENGYPPLRRISWDIDPEVLLLAGSKLPFIGAAAALLVWTFARTRSFWIAAEALTLMPLVVMSVYLWQEQLRIRGFEDWMPDNIARWRVIAGVLPRLAAAALLAASLYPALLALDLAASPNSQTFALVTFADVGFCGGLMFAILGYLASRHRRPTALQKRKPPQPLGRWFRFGRSGLTFRAAYPDAQRMAMGSIGEIPNSAPPAAENAHHMIRIPLRKVASLAIEIMLFTWITWDVFAAMIGGPWRVLKVPCAALLTLAFEDLLLKLYSQVFIYTRERRQGPGLFWRRLRFAWSSWLSQFIPSPCWSLIAVLTTLDLIAWLASAPMAPPVISMTLAAAVAAAFACGRRYIRLHSSGEEVDSFRSSP